MIVPPEKCVTCGQPAVVMLNNVPYCSEHAYEKVAERPQRGRR